MQLPISINIRGVVEEFDFSESEAKSLSQYILNSVVDNYVRKWEENIDESLHQTRNEYKKAIFQESPDDNSIVIGMSPRYSKLAMMLEDGASSFDIKEGFSKSNKRVVKLATNKDGSLKRDKDGKTSQGGWYLTIPFKFATSEAVAESMMFSSRLPKPIEQLAKTATEPLRLTDLPSEFYFDVNNNFSPYGQNKTSGYNHKFNIYEGLKREEIGSGTEKRGGYMTFRRVSENSDKDSWQHPGFEALNLMEKSVNQTDIANIVDHAIDQFLAKTRSHLWDR